MGREPELQVVRQLVAGARVGQSGVLVITGEPGIGKTALLAEAAGRAAGMRVLRATGTEAESEVPFGGLLHLLGPALGVLDEIPGPRSDALAGALALRPGSPGDRFAVGAATLSLLCRYAEEGPVAVLVDDLQLLDGSSAEALAFAARRLTADPIVLLATARTADTDDQDAAWATLPRLRLTGIDLEAARELLSSQTHEAVRADLVARLHRATAGNPLALIELAGDLDRLEGVSPEVPLPVSTVLAKAFAQRAARLQPSERTALLVAAVVGADLRTIALACTELALDTRSLGAAEDGALIRIVDDRVEFGHPLIRSAVYSTAAPGERRAVHRAVAAALPADDVERRAWHLCESALGPDAAIADLLVLAGDRAKARSAHAMAATAYERAARLTSRVGQRATRYADAAEAAWLAGAGNHAGAVLDEAEALRPGPPGRARIAELRGAIAARTGSLTDARDILTAAAHESRSPDTSAVLLADAVSACFYLGDAPGARALGATIDAVLPAVTGARARVLSTMASGMARILGGADGEGRLLAAVRMLASTDELRSDPRHQEWLILGPLWLRDSDSGADLRRAVDDIRDRAAVGTLPLLLSYVARDEATTNRWARAEATYTEAIGLARELGQTTELVFCLTGLGWLLARQGRASECRALITEATPICTARQLHLGRVWSLLALGELELGLGQPAAAIEHLAAVGAFLQELGFGDPDVSPAPELVEAYLRVGSPDRAHEVSWQYHERAAAKGQPWARARAGRALGMTAADGDLDETFGSALDLHAQTLDLFESARTRLAYGARLRRARRRVDARPHLREAMRDFERLGAVPWAEAAAVELAATGEAVRRRQTTAVDALTPQELQISQLLAEGRTTRQAAAALFLSPKTVEYHLRKVYTKLGVRSRTELAAALPS